MPERAGATTAERLCGYLSIYKHKYPTVWKKFDEFRVNRKSVAGISWQEWCFCPLELARKIVPKPEEYSLSLTQETSILTGLAAWRATQGIYRFDETIFEAVWKTKVAGNLPIEILYRLPEWCLYIETPGKYLGSTKLSGFFVYLNGSSKERDELRFIFDAEGELVDFPLCLSKTTILESLKAMIGEQTYQGKKIGIDSLQYISTLREIEAEIEPLISLTLYICTQLLEISNFDKHREINYNCKQHRIYPPEKASVWEVGFRLGAAIRKSGEQSVASTASDATDRSRPRPHIRRAHWHGFWTGSKQTGQEFQLKWLPPMAVNIGEDNSIVPSIKKIE